MVWPDALVEPVLVGCASRMTQAPSPPGRPAPPRRRLFSSSSSSLLVFTLAALLVAVAYLRDLGRNPYGFFCDEALIGVQARQLLDGTRPEGSFALFYSHFGTTAGSLPVYATAPFVWILGLSEFSVRFASVCFMLATFVVLYRTFRHLGIASPWLPVLMFALTPIVIHISRVNFGHAPSLFFLALGYHLYLRGRDTQRMWPAVGGGMAIGVSAYGYPGFYIATPVFLCIALVTELTFQRFRVRRARHLLAFVAAALICMSPIVHRGMTDPEFSRRFEDKDAADYGLISAERAEVMIQNYPKYFSFDFLFQRGDAAFPGAFIQRHAVEGAGLLSWTILPLLALGLLSFAAGKRGVHARACAPFVVLAFLFPVPDLVSTTSSQPPYTFAIFTGALLIPFVVVLGLATLESWRRCGSGAQTSSGQRPSLGDPAGADPLRSIGMLVTSTRFIAVIVLVSAFLFVFGTYARYPLVSSGYWGWQAGPREMIGYYVDHQEQYDAFYMEGSFNQPEIFLAFYIDDPSARDDASIGNTEALDPAQRQLFGISRESFEKFPDADDWTVLATVMYPNDEIAFYLIERKTG